MNAADQEIARLKRELDETKQALEDAQSQIQGANRLKAQFLATMSHELRTPMNAIIGFTRLVLRRGSEQLSNRNRENLEKVKLSADHLLALINDILDLSKIEAGRVEIVSDNFDLQALLQSCSATVGPALGKAGVDLVVEVDEVDRRVCSDEARLRQILINLLSNAIKFTKKGQVAITE